MTLLLIVIYAAFIGLGVPDSLIGSAWPAIYTEFSVTVDSVSFITLLISGCTVLSSLFSTRVLNRFGTHAVTAVSTAMTALSLIGFSFAPCIWWMLPFAAVLGLGAGAIDAGLNNYVALHFSARQMNFLHGFYGIGVTLSPYLMSVALSNTGWRDGYRYAALVQVLITVTVIISFPLWKRKGDENQAGITESRSLSLLDMLRIPGLKTAWVIMLATNAIEYACGVWGGTYLVNAKGFAVDRAAAALSLYYLGMALGRLTSGLISSKVGTWTRIGIGVGIVSVAAVGMILPLPAVFSVIALALIGLGNGSIYPNFIHLTPENFGKENSQAVMGSLIAFAYTGVMLAPPLVGFVTGAFGIEIYPIMLLSLLVIMAASILLFVLRLKKTNSHKEKEI
ncbi:MAG: MFS transporter [Clostridia bacterium]|nr:MFS transporter [Clostridia bacterium]